MQIRFTYKMNCTLKFMLLSQLLGWENLAKLTLFNNYFLLLHGSDSKLTKIPFKRVHKLSIYIISFAVIFKAINLEKRPFAKSWRVLSEIGVLSEIATRKLSVLLLYYWMVYPDHLVKTLDFHRTSPNIYRKISRIILQLW